MVAEHNGWQQIAYYVYERASSSLHCPSMSTMHPNPTRSCCMSDMVHRKRFSRTRLRQTLTELTKFTSCWPQAPAAQGQGCWQEGKGKSLIITVNVYSSYLPPHWLNPWVIEHAIEFHLALLQKIPYYRHTQSHNLFISQSLYYLTAFPLDFTDKHPMRTHPVRRLSLSEYTYTNFHFMVRYVVVRRPWRLEVALLPSWKWDLRSQGKINDRACELSFTE